MNSPGELAPDPPSGEPRSPEDRYWPPRRKGDNLAGAGLLGMRIFLISLSVPFVAAIIGYVSMRHQTRTWGALDGSELPLALWGSTAILIIGSLATLYALRSVRAENQRGLRGGITVGLVCATAFLTVQTTMIGGWLADWRREGLLGADAVEHHELGHYLYRTAFLSLMVFHLAHAIGGFIYQIIVSIKTYRGRYRYYHHPEVLYLSHYWHFLDLTWIALIATVWFTRVPPA